MADIYHLNDYRGPSSTDDIELPASLAPLVETGRDSFYFLTLFPGTWAEDLKSLRSSHIASGNTTAQKQDEFQDALVKIISRNASHCQANLFSSATAFVLPLSLCAWTISVIPPADWGRFFEFLTKKPHQNFVDVTLALCSAAVTALFDQALSRDLVALAKTIYGSIEVYLDMEMACFNDIDYSFCPPLFSALVFPAVNALQAFGSNDFPGLVSKVARCMPNIGDRKLTGVLQGAMLTRQREKATATGVKKEA